MSRQTITVEGMSCQHCVETIQEGVGKLPGIREVKVNLEKKEVAVNFDDALTNLSMVSEKIKELGFSPEKGD